MLLVLSDIHYERLDGVFNMDDADRIVGIVRGFNASADFQTAAEG